MTAADVGRNFAATVAGEAAVAPFEVALEAAAVRYGLPLLQQGLSNIGNIRPPSGSFLGWVGAVFAAWQLGIALGNYLGDIFKPQMVADLLADYDYVKTSDCGIAWEVMSDVYDYPVCGIDFVVPELPAGLSTDRPAAITMWGPISGSFAGNPTRFGSQKWMRVLAPGASVRGFPAVGLPRVLSRPNVPALGIFPDVFSWAEPRAVPLSIVASVPFVEGVRVGGNHAPRAVPVIAGPYHFEITLTAPGYHSPPGSVGRTPVRVLPGAVPAVVPRFWEKEKKLLSQTRAGRAAIATFKTLDFLNDFNGAVAALWRAIPVGTRSRYAGPTARWDQLVHHAGSIDWTQASANALKFAAWQYLGGLANAAQRDKFLSTLGDVHGWGLYRVEQTALGSERHVARLLDRDEREDVRGP